uniref:Uncharacterized protein n=1 Tax=Myoviridae sp. ctu2j3 TaxID=2825197 RepID=A0A8S5UI17_9CAUD|nr:MAG TPA: hypothetical protein [Myoviridae sp. ctu2j3]DAF94283.1 MAG TPA: hypothetical protein [Myoviridae sp. ctu2j3]
MGTWHVPRTRPRYGTHSNDATSRIHAARAVNHNGT